jgi:mannose-6-phosphate isomerase-like protein (cupin superfamily)
VRRVRDLIYEPHVHPILEEVYLVARGTSQLRVGHQTLHLAAGIVVIVEAGEPHTFLTSSTDYLHFVLQIPGHSAAGSES